MLFLLQNTSIFRNLLQFLRNFQKLRDFFSGSSLKSRGNGGSEGQALKRSPPIHGML